MVLRNESAPVLRLAEQAAQILRDWAGLGSSAEGLPGRKPAEGMVCLATAVELGGPALLAVSGSHRLGATLAVNATGDPGAGSFSGEALRELCILLRERLDPGAALAPLPECLDDWNWPGHNPSDAVRLQVQGHSLELRLWQL